MLYLVDGLWLLLRLKNAGNPEFGIARTEMIQYLDIS
jgi:hypothetical protein